MLLRFSRIPLAEYVVNVLLTIAILNYLKRCSIAEAASLTRPVLARRCCDLLESVVLSIRPAAPGLAGLGPLLTAGLMLPLLVIIWSYSAALRSATTARWSKIFFSSSEEKPSFYPHSISNVFSALALSGLAHSGMALSMASCCCARYACID